MALSREEKEELFQELFNRMFFPEELGIHIFPGGKMPVRSTDLAIGFDFFLRAIVDPSQMDPGNILRKTRFDFLTSPRDNPEFDAHMMNYPTEEGVELAYRLDPGESVLGGVGCCIEMPFPMFHWVAPRSGLATKWKITISNAPGTVDPDYRGEAGVAILNINDKPIPLTKNMKIAQAILSYAVIPQKFVEKSYEELSKTKRGVGGFGSTGIR